MALIGRRGATWIGVIAGALILAAAIWWFWRSPSTLSVVALGAVAALAIAVLARFLTGFRKTAWPEETTTGWDKITKSVADIMPLVTLLALCIGAGLYFLERKDKYRISFSVEASAVRMVPGPDGARRVLLTIRIPVENKGARQVVVRCMAVDVLRPTAGAELRRNDFAREEIAMDSLQEPIDYRSVDAARCLEGEESKFGHPRGSIHPLFMWRPLTLEPNDVDDLYFELPISCAYPFVRVLVKMRINPGDELSNETKTIVPLTDICSGAQDSRSGVSMPTIEGGGAGGDSAAASTTATH